MDGSQLPRRGIGEDRGGPAPPWTIKGVPQAERDRMNAAAKRAQLTLGQWLIETARWRIEAERAPAVRPVGAAVVTSADPRPVSPVDLAALMRELPGLAAGKRCGAVALDVRRLLRHELRRFLPPQDTRPSRTRPR